MRNSQPRQRTGLSQHLNSWIWYSSRFTPNSQKKTDCLQLDTAEMVFEGGHFLCEMCRKIDFHDLLQNPRQVNLYSDASETSPHTMQYANDCELCSLMFQNTPSDDMKKTLELRSFSYKKTSHRFLQVDPNAQDIISLKVAVPSETGFWPFSPTSSVFCRLAKDGAQDPYCVQPVHDTWDCNKARLWLDSCVGCHGSICKEEILRVSGMNLIDCEDMIIVEAAQEMRWLALSYVWGANYQTEGHSGYRSGSRISLDAPRTISDAISVTIQLGYRYLWVDEYCIDQNDPEHRSDQIQKMDQIYCGADLTIVAAAGEDKRYGLPGVSSTKRKERISIRVDDVVVFANGPEAQWEAYESKWFSRAW